MALKVWLSVSLLYYCLWDFGLDHIRWVYLMRQNLGEYKTLVQNVDSFWFINIHDYDRTNYELLVIAVPFNTNIFLLNWASNKIQFEAICYYLPLIDNKKGNNVLGCVTFHEIKK